MKKYLLSSLFYILIINLFLVSPILSKVYDIPKNLLDETKHNYKIYKQNPDSSEARFELAMSYGYTGRIEKGWSMLKTIPESYAPVIIKKYGKLATDNPLEWKYKFKLAFGYFFTKKKIAAINEFKKILKIEPNHVWAMGFIALLEGERNNTDKAIDWCKTALQIEPNATAIHFLLAEGYRRKGNYWGMVREGLIVGRLKTEEKLVYPDEDS
jgi:tetratricopeptide (TPR) repeat protein